MITVIREVTLPRASVEGCGGLWVIKKQQVLHLHKDHLLERAFSQAEGSNCGYA
jgi:hypothetical protein